MKEILARVLNATGFVGAVLAARRRRPVILRYHRVYGEGPEPAYELGLPRALFEAQLDFLCQHCHVVSLAQVFDALFRGKALPEHAVAITFDDGYKDNFTEAFPALRSRRLPATVFIAVENVERAMPFWWDRLAAAIHAAPNGPVALDLGGGMASVTLNGPDSRRRVVEQACEAFKLMPHAEAGRRLEAALRALGTVADSGDPVLSWDDVRAMAEGGIEIGSHTLDHPVLSRLSPEEASWQIVESRRRAEDRLKRPVRFFAYPNGKRDDVTPTVRELVRKAGYTGAVSTIQGRPSPASDPFLVERIGVSAGLAADAAGRLSEPLFATELAGIYDTLFLRKRRDRAVH
jgi:peptidoglycan/xylan/chitin deacetylase (PgdA/CDA1 family)